MAKLLIAAACLLLIQTAGQAQVPDEITRKITVAKDTFYADRDKAEKSLLDLLDRKEAAAKQAGDIKAIEAVRAETEAFRKVGTLPKLVPLTSYDNTMKLAVTKLQNVYAAAIKTYALADKLEEAKELQKNLDAIVAAVKKTPSEPDPFQVNSVWVRAKSKLVILERQGEKFKAKYVSPQVERIVAGTIVNQEIRWLGKDSKIIRGDNDGDHLGKISQDNKGWKIDFTWYLNGKEQGSFTQRLAD